MRHGRCSVLRWKLRDVHACSQWLAPAQQNWATANRADAEAWGIRARRSCQRTSAGINLVAGFVWSGVRRREGDERGSIDCAGYKTAVVRLPPTWSRPSAGDGLSMGGRTQIPIPRSHAFVRIRTRTVRFTSSILTPAPSSGWVGSRTDKHPTRYRQRRRIHRRPALTRPRHVTAAPTAATRNMTDEHPARRELVTGGAVLRWPDHPLVVSAAHEFADCGHDPRVGRNTAQSLGRWIKPGPREPFNAMGRACLRRGAQLSYLFG